MNAHTPTHADTRSRGQRWSLIAALVIGWAVIAYGVRAAVAEGDDAPLYDVFKFVVFFDVLHDVVVAPVAVVVAWLIGRIVPDIARGPVRAATATSALLTFSFWPAVQRWGARPSTPSALPLNYGRHLLIVLAMIWICAAVTIARRRRQGPHARPESPSDH
jgi:hypothetical protein